MNRTVLWSALCLATISRADGIPTTEPLAYSGVLLNSVGTPVTSAVSARLSLWDDQTATLSANKKCETSVPTLTPDSGGRFRIVLDPTCLPAVKTNPNLWVQIEIGTSALPRTKLGAVPYAVEADRAALATNAATANSAGGALATTVNGKADTAALNALIARVATLEARMTITTIDNVNAVSTDPGYANCVNGTGIFVVGACTRMASATCVLRGYRGGWFDGNILNGNVRVICIR
jgi:hypothetical protein